MSPIAINAGEFRHVVELLKPVQTRLDLGENQATTWELDSVARAKVTPGAVSTETTGEQIELQEATTFEMRFHRGIDSTWRVRYLDETFDVVSAVNVEEANRLTQLVCEKVTR